METNFIDLNKKMIIIEELKSGDAKSIKLIFDEIQRLESIIRDYELGIRLLNEKFESKTFKQPVVI